MSELRQIERHGVLVIAAEGRIDAAISPRLEELLRQALAGGQTRLVVDLAAVTYVSSSCLRALLVGARQAREQKGDLKLCALAPRVRQIFALAGFDQVFELWDSCQQAVSSFAAPPGGSAHTWASD